MTFANTTAQCSRCPVRAKTSPMNALWITTPDPSGWAEPVQLTRVGRPTRREAEGAGVRPGRMNTPQPEQAVDGSRGVSLPREKLRGGDPDLEMRGIEIDRGLHGRARAGGIALERADPSKLGPCLSPSGAQRDR